MWKKAVETQYINYRGQSFLYRLNHIPRPFHEYHIPISRCFVEFLPNRKPVVHDDYRQGGRFRIDHPSILKQRANFITTSLKTTVKPIDYLVNGFGESPAKWPNYSG